MTQEEFTQALKARHGKQVQEKLEGSCVGIAGLGGLGSNIAFFLARLGVGKLVLVDYDKVDISNLNRQQYRITDLGLPKTEALKSQLLGINPWCAYEIHTVRVEPDNVVELFQDCQVICEAFDDPGEKAMLTEQVLGRLLGCALVSGSGMAGFSSANDIHTVRPMKQLYICGDGTSGVEEGGGLAATRVALCAAHEAHMALRLLLGYEEP